MYNPDSMSKQITGYNSVIPEKVLNLANIGIWKWDVKKGEVYWSSSFRKIFGFKKKTYSGMFDTLVNRVHPGDKSGVLKKLQNALEKDNEFSLVFRIKLLNGTVHWLSANGVVLRGKDGIASEVRGICIDISRSKSLEKELKRTINQLNAVFSSVKVGITVEIKPGLVIYSNNEMARILGKESSEELHNQSIRKLLKIFIIKNKKGDLVKLTKLPAAEVFAGKKKVTKIYSFENKKTGIIKWMKITATAVDSEKLPTDMVVKVFHDVTKEYEQQQNTLASLGVASHELKNALAGVKAYIQLVKKRIEKGDTVTAKNYTETLDLQSNRLIKLINDLLDVSRIQSGYLNLNKKTFNYSEFLKNLTDDFKNSHSDFKISSSIARGIEIEADQDRVMQVLLNLFTNAIKYSEKGSKIKVSLMVKDNFAVTAVKDSGYGISKSDQHRVFELFKRGSGENVEKTKGLGIGLFTSNAIVKEHGGKIRLKSNIGKGTTFFVELPIN